jgi:hypothetical protein
MAHFAELDVNNTVLRVLVTDNNDPNGDEGYQWLVDNLGGTWKKTSFNTFSLHLLLYLNFESVKILERDREKTKSIKKRTKKFSLSS